MKAAWYEQPGVAKEVLKVGELPTPEPGPEEVRVKVSYSGVNPGDTKKRSDWMGLGMSYPLIVPHSDGAGTIDTVGTGVDENRIGQRVWIYGAQSYRRFGTAAEYCVVPSEQAVDLPDDVSEEIGATLGIPGITAHELVLSDGTVKNKNVLIQGVLGGVGALAAQIAHNDGAKVYGTVRTSEEMEHINHNYVDVAFALDDESVSERIKAVAPNGIDRIIEVSLSDNADLDASIVAMHGIIAAYATRHDRPEIPFWPMLFSNVTIKLHGSDDFTATAKRRAALNLTEAVKQGKISIPVGKSLPLDAVADAHDMVDAGTRQRIILKIN